MTLTMRLGSGISRMDASTLFLRVVPFDISLGTAERCFMDGIETSFGDEMFFTADLLYRKIKRDVLRCQSVTFGISTD